MTKQTKNRLVSLLLLQKSGLLKRGKAKQEVMFHLNETLAIGSGKPGDKSTEERVPIEHKFMMNYPGNQALYILKQPDDASKGFRLNFSL